MNEDRSAKVDRLLEEAIAEKSEDRLAYLQRACTDDALRAEVLSLLSWHERAGDFLEEPIVSLVPSETDEEPAFVDGQIVANRFEIIRLIERGGQGEVYHAYDRVLAEDVALKTVLPEISNSTAAKKRMEQEIRLARKISHPNVCRVHDVFHHSHDEQADESSTTMLLSMELLAGETLAALLHREAPLPWARTISSLKDIARGLDAAHHEGIVHRDLKPANVMLVDDGGATRAVITDFGLAAGGDSKTSAAPGSDPSPRASDGAVWGTPGYMSPEHFAGKKATPQSDLFSFGVIAHELLTSERPVAHDGDGAITIADAPKDLEALVSQCLHRDAAKRPESAASLNERLDNVRKRQRWRKTMLRFAGAAALVSGLFFAALGYESWRPKTIAWSSYTESQQAQAAMNAGLQALRDGENIAAIPHFERALAEDDDFLLARVKLVEALLNTGDHRRAAGEVEQLARFSHETGSDVLEQGLATAVVARFNLDYHAASKHYESLWAGNRDDIDLGLTLARAYEETGEAARALEQYEATGRLGVGTIASLLGRARSLEIVGDSNGSIAYLNESKSYLANSGPEAQGMFYSIRGVAERHLMRLDQSRSDLNHSWEFRQRIGDIRGQSATLTNLASVEQRAGNLEAASVALTQALSLARLAGDVTYESFALTNMGDASRRRGLLREAFAFYGESLEIERERGEFVELASRLSSLAVVNLAMGQYGDSVVFLDQAMDYSQQAGDSQTLARAFHLLGRVRHSQGKLEESLAALRRSQSTFAELRLTAERADVSVRIAEVHLRLGDHSRADALLQSNLSDAVESLDQTTSIRAGITDAERYIALGDHDKALDALENARSRLRFCDKKVVLMHALTEGVLQRIVGNHTDALSILTDVLEESRERGYFDETIRALVEIARAYLDEGNVSAARGFLDDAIRQAKDTRARPRLAEASVLMSELALAQDDSESAETWARRAIEEATAYSGRPVLFRAHAALGASLVGRGDSSDENAAFAEALKVHDWIAPRIPPSHRDSYLNRADVKRILNAINR